jgi:hypothetical protein
LKGDLNGAGILHWQANFTFNDNKIIVMFNLPHPGGWVKGPVRITELVVAAVLLPAARG